ncbi:hypothetical protein, partial [Pedobacter suwonensis]|uniref:hypothetical protein n=1 Tax=Pedobacter suwonensis TaxID=332999 RepID=UPI003C2E1CC0
MKGATAATGASPYSTGGGGTVLEHRYAAVLLSALLTHDSLAELGDSVLVPVEIKLQASDFSKVDDIVIIGRREHDEDDFHVCIGVRRDPQIVPSSEATVKLIHSYLREVTEHWGEMKTGRRRLVLAVADRNVHSTEVASLTQIAAGKGSAEFRAAAARSGPTNVKVRARLEELDQVVAKAAALPNIDTSGVATEELTWRLLSALKVHHLRLEDGDSRDRSQVVNRLRGVAALDTVPAAEAVLGRIEDLVGTWAPSAAHVTEAMLRRELAARLKPRFSSLGSGPKKVEPDALVRGPVAHLGLDRELDQAKVLEAGDPAGAATRYEQIAKALEESAWAPFALSLRQRQARAHHKAGDHDAGAAVDVTVLAAALQTGEVWRAVSVIRQLADDQIEASDNLIRAANALGDLAAFEYSHEVSLDDVTTSIDALRPDDPNALLAASWFAEHAVASGSLDLVQSRVGFLIELADGAAHDDALLQARLRACVADSDQSGTKWTALLREARSSYPPPVVALLQARHARYLAEAGQADEALAKYDDAIERAVHSENHQDAASWTEAHNLVRIRYGLQTDKVGEAYPTATALRAAGRGSALPVPFSVRERALGRLTGRAQPAECLQALTQYLRYAVVTASWLEEREAHELLGRFHLDNGQVAVAAANLIAAGSDKLLKDLAKRLPEEPFPFPVPDDWSVFPRWKRNSTLTGLQAVSDLLPDDHAHIWLDAALTEIADAQTAPIGTSNARHAALRLYAELAGATTTGQAQRFLDLTAQLLKDSALRHPAAGKPYAQALIRIALRHPGILRVEAADRMCQALLAEYTMANVVLSRGGDALTLQPSVVAERCTAAAANGSTEAALALILAHTSADAARPLAQTLLDRALGRQDGIARSTSASPAQAALLIGQLLPADDRESLADTLNSRIRNKSRTADQRQDDLDALETLAAHLSHAQRSHHLATAMEAARGLLDGSAQDDINSSHPYARLRVNMGPTTLRYHGLSAAAALAHTPVQAQKIIEVALPLLAQTEGTSEARITQALAKLPHDSRILPLPVLAGHSSQRVRALAARLWCTAGARPVGADLGTLFAADPSPLVRCTLAHFLPH